MGAANHDPAISGVARALVPPGIGRLGKTNHVFGLPLLHTVLRDLGDVVVVPPEIPVCHLNEHRHDMQRLQG
jgi:hypothetical protein